MEETFVEWSLVQAIEEIMERLMSWRAELLACETPDSLNHPTEFGSSSDPSSPLEF
jgi:hypothetical protein